MDWSSHQERKTDAGTARGPCACVSLLARHAKDRPGQRTKCLVQNQEPGDSGVQGLHQLPRLALSKYHLLLLLAAASGVIVAAGYFSRFSDDTQAARRDARASVSIADPQQPGVARPRSSTADAAPNAPSARTTQDRRKRADAFRRQLAWLRQTADTPPDPESRNQQRAAAGDDGYARMPSLRHSGNQATEPLGEYIRDLVRRDFVPMAGSCYEELLERQPHAAGKLVVDVVVVGDTSVGGVVDEVELGDDTTLTDEAFTTCVRESMMAMVFDAPPDGRGKLTFSYPFEFAP